MDGIEFAWKDGFGTFYRLRVLSAGAILAGNPIFEQSPASAIVSDVTHKMGYESNIPLGLPAIAEITLSIDVAALPPSHLAVLNSAGLISGSLTGVFSTTVPGRFEGGNATVEQEVYATDSFGIQYIQFTILSVQSGSLPVSLQYSPPEFDQSSRFEGYGNIQTFIYTGEEVAPVQSRPFWILQQSSDGINHQDLFRGIQQLVPGRKGTVSHARHIQEFTIVEATRVAIESVSWSDVDFSEYIFDGNAGDRFVQLFRLYDAIGHAASLYYSRFSRGIYNNVLMSGIGASVSVPGIGTLSDAWCLYLRPNNLPTLWRPADGTIGLFDEWDNPFDFIADSVEGFFQRVEYIYSSGTVTLQAKNPHVGAVSHLPLSAAFGDYAYEEGGASYRGCRAEFIVSQNKLSYSNIARVTARKEEWAMSPPFHTRGNNVLGRQVARLFSASDTTALITNVDSIRFAVDSFMAVFGDVESYVLDIKKSIWNVGLGSLVSLDLGILGERIGVVVGREFNLKTGYSSYQIRTFNL